MRTSQSQRDDEHSTETARRCSGDYSPDQQLDGETGEQDLALHRAGRERPGQDAPPRRQYHEETDNLINVADNSNQDELEDAKEASTESWMH